jgi:FkbM family methyltransferase
MSTQVALIKAVRMHLPGFAPTVIFDVGANNGATAETLATSFPSAIVYAFEPVADTFRTLADKVSRHDRIRPFNLALGARSKRARMRIKSVSVSNHVAGWRDFWKPGETVTMTRGDDFCDEHGVERIGLLKIDTEGHDLQVLAGFKKALGAARVDLIEAEVGMNPENTRHAPFEAVKHYLERFGYRLFLIYEQTYDKPFSGRAVLRRCNAVFVSEKLAQGGARRAGVTVARDSSRSDQPQQ